MKVITEAMLRDELRHSEAGEYYVPEGKMLSPAAREYLQQKKIKICKGSAPAAPQPQSAPPAEGVLSGTMQITAKYRDYETGALYAEKPEYMTQLFDDVLVVKNNPRIAFRGKLDSLQALIVVDQALLSERGGNEKTIAGLGEILSVLREIMRCDALNEPLRIEKIIGLTPAELRERSHAPMKYYHVQYMRLPDYKMGLAYALLNQLRAAAREAEVAAVNAFKNGREYERPDILEIFNRLSSAVHIMMCLYLEEHKL
ncbi:MAG: ATP-binding protein [Synergistaceae bacterium]|nr:ATP-binding protein [Synergistaceae bacterium]